jgi:hypothetical protein
MRRVVATALLPVRALPPRKETALS